MKTHIESEIKKEIARKHREGASASALANRDNCSTREIEQVIRNSSQLTILKKQEAQKEGGLSNIDTFCAITICIIRIFLKNSGNNTVGRPGKKS